MPDEAPWSTAKATLYSLVSRNPRSNRRISEMIELGSDARVLDIGCGPGAAVRAVAGTVERAVGVDASLKMVEIARRRSASLSNAEFFVGSAEALPFPAATFTSVWTIQSWHHWNDSLAGLTEAARVLEPGGIFAVIERKTKGDHGLSENVAAELEAELVSVGFERTSVRRHRKFLVVSGSVGPS